MKTFKEWFEECFPDEEFPTGVVNGEWFQSHGLPMVVCCYACTTSMVLFSAHIDDEGRIFCSDCACPD